MLFFSRSPPKPVPEFGPDPHDGPTEEDSARRMPASGYFPSALHPRTQQGLGIGHRNSRIENAVISLKPAHWADDRDRSIERARWKAIQFDASFLSSGHQADVVLVDRDIHQS